LEENERKKRRMGDGEMKSPQIKLIYAHKSAIICEICGKNLF
jgi:hypothetical protein